MAQRGESGLSLIVGVNKPLGLSSHDVVNRCRSIFNERRVGHAGTLDPLASGVLPLCVGPATRLNDYLSAKNKEYRFTVCFGARTNTDDSAGEVIEGGSVPDEVFDPLFASSFVKGMVGCHEQIPPAFSAIKVKGVRAYKAARKGDSLDLEPRHIEIYKATLLGISEATLPDTGESTLPGIGESTPLTSPYPSWDIEVCVSKGTYIRSLARDIGEALGCPAHVGSLQRTRVGWLPLEKCASLQELETDAMRFVLDPVKLLEFPDLLIQESQERAIEYGRSIELSELVGCTLGKGGKGRALSKGNSGDQVTFNFSDRVTFADLEELEREFAHLNDEELIALSTQESLRAIYGYDKSGGVLKPRCVFSVGVLRG